MNTLILHPTDTSQWHALVYEAQTATKLILTENTESYLVFLLMRFTQTTQLLDSVIALDFLESSECIGQRRIDHLQEVGDKSLLLCGLFPGIVRKRRVGIDYYSNIGQSAYLTVSELYNDKSSELYHQLSAQFTNLQNVLQAMRTQKIIPQ